MIEEAVAVAVGEEVDRIEEHRVADPLRGQILADEQVGVIDDTRQPEDTGHDGYDHVLKVARERRHRRRRP